MPKGKSAGTEYQIKIKSKWDDIAEVARTAKELIENTQETQGLFSLDENELVDRTLKAYIVPQEEENFVDYKRRFIQFFAGTGLRSKIANLTIRKKLPLNFNVTRNEGESILVLNSVTREGEYELTIGVSGEYSERGNDIAEGIKKHIESKDIEYKHESLDKIITY